MLVTVFNWILLRDKTIWYTYLQMNNTVVVNIDILDENDNSPRILNTQPIIFAVQEGQPNAFVGQILASDSDLGESGRVTFSIIPPNQ